MKTLKNSKLWKAAENTISCQFDSIGYVLNLSEKTFIKKILILYPHVRYTININSMKNYNNFTDY